MKTADELYNSTGDTKEEIVIEDTTGVKDESTDESKVKETETADAETDTKTEDKPKSDDVSPASGSETMVPVSAIHGERDRRKAAEGQRDELQSKLDEANKTPPTSVFEDETKWREEITAGFNQQLTNHSLNQSEFFAARELGREKLDKKIAIFKTLVETNPDLGQRFANAVSPYHELVDIVDQHDDLDKMKDIDAYKATLKAEARVEVKAEMEAEGKAKGDLLDSVPDSLVGDASKGGISSKGSFEPPTADELYNS